MAHDVPNPMRAPARSRALVGVSALVLVAMVLHSFAAVCEAVQIAPLTGERLTVRYLSAAAVRGVKLVCRRTTEKPGEASIAKRYCEAEASGVVCAGVRGSLVRARQAEHHLSRLKLDLPPPATC